MGAADGAAPSGAEWALRLTSADRLIRALFDNNDDGFALIEVRLDQGRTVDCRNLASNDALQRHTGLLPEEIRGRWASEYLPNMEQAWLDAMGAAITTGKPQRLERYQDDTGRWYEVVNFPVEGDIIGQFFRDVTDRHVAAEQLGESQAQFQMLAENSSDLVFSATTGPDATFGWVSPSCYRLLGWPASDMLGRPVVGFVHPDDRAALVEALRAVDEQGQAVVESRWARTHGAHRWFNLGLHRVPDPRSGEPVVVGGARMVEAERRARERLHRNEARLKATLDSLLDPHVVLQTVRDRQGEITDFVAVDANDAAGRFVVLPYHELIGARLLDVAPQFGEHLLPALGDVVDSGEPLVLDDFAEIAATDLVGHRRRFDLRAVKLDDGLSFTWRDVTDRYEGRQQLFASEERFRLAVSSVPTGIAVLDLDGRFDFVNPAFCSILQRGTDWLLRRDMKQVLYPGEFAKLRHMISLLTAGKGPVQQSMQRFVASDGNPVDAYHTVALLHRADGEPVGLLSHIQPVQAGANGSAAQFAGTPSVARTTVLVTADERGSFPALGTAAVLGQRPELIALPWCPAGDLRARLTKDTPEVLVVVTSPGVAGPAQLARIMTDVEAVAPQTGLVVLSGNNRTQVEGLLRQRTGPSAFLPIASVRSEDVLAQAIATVSQGMGAFDPSALDALIGRTDQPTDTRLSKLSDREMEVLALLAEGLDNQGIANRLYVSVKACENYIGSIFRKLGLNAEDGTNRRVRATLIFLGER